MKVLITSNSFGKFDEAPRKRMLDLGWELLDNRYHHIMSEEEMMNEVPGVDAIILGSDIVSKRVLDKADKLKIISRYGVGIDNIDTAEAEKRGIAVTVTKNCNTEAVADYTIALMLATLRHVCNVHSSLQKGIWKKETGMDLCHKTVGVFGLGAIGRQVVKRLKGFECKILGYDIFADEEYCEKEGICLLSPQEIFKQADIITLHVPGKISLKVLSVKDAIGYLNEDGKHEKIIILVKTPVVLDELSDAGVRLKSINVGGIGAKAGRKPMFKNISVSEEEKEAFRNLLNKGINVFLRVIVTEPEEDIAKYL